MKCEIKFFWMANEEYRICRRGESILKEPEGVIQGMLRNCGMSVMGMFLCERGIGRDQFKIHLAMSSPFHTARIGYVRPYVRVRGE